MDEDMDRRNHTTYAEHIAWMGRRIATLEAALRNVANAPTGMRYDTLRGTPCACCSAKERIAREALAEKGSGHEG